MAIGIRIDYKKTKYAVEKMFEDYELLKFRLSYENMPKMTASYSLVYSKPSGKPKSKIEDFVERREELSAQLEGFIRDLVSAFNRLDPDERKIINYKFFSQQPLPDETAAFKIGMTEYTYLKIKKQAYIKLALAMNIEVYEGKGR
jgi:ArpU family phage transcriptional regulator